MFAAFLVGLLVLLAAVPPATALTYDEEREMGREIYAEVRKMLPFVEDPAINGYLNGLGWKILQPLGPQPFEYRFFVIRNETINAFAMPGGYVYLTTGAFAALESEGQLAAIVSHEIAHVTERHIAQRIARNTKLTWVSVAGMLAGALLGGAPGAAVMMGSMGANLQAQLAYSREDERDADGKGLEYLSRAGYSKRSMMEAFEKMQDASFHIPRDIPTYLTTHPDLVERIDSARRRLGGEKAASGGDASFQTVKNRVMALYIDSLRARNYFDARLREDPADPVGHHGLALLYMREQNYGKAESEMKLALKYAPDNPDILTDLGDVYFDQKKYSAARGVLEKAKNLTPRSVRLLFLLGRTYEETNMTDQALSMYERTLVQDPVHEQALYRVGLIYGQKGDLARAHLSTGLYFKARAETEKALYHFRQAQEHGAAAPPNVRERIDRNLRELTADKEKESRPPN